LFSTEYQQKIKIVSLQNKIVPRPAQTTTSLKLYNFLIYPSNGSFKNCILPFISSSEILLKIFLFFQKLLIPNVYLEKFLPYSTIKKTAIDMQDSYFVHIFQNEYSFFNPILHETSKIALTDDFLRVILHSRTNYKTCTIIEKNIEKDSMFALFSSNTIFPLKTYVLKNNLEIFAACDEENNFFAAIKTSSGKLTAISQGIFISTIQFPDYLDCILEAHDLNSFSKISLKVFDFYHKYNQFVWKIWDKIGLLFLPGLYHALIFPFHILSIPFELFLFQNNFILFGIFSKNLIFFWILPYMFYFIFTTYFASVMDSENNYIIIEPLETMWAVPYLLQRKKASANEFDLHTTLFVMFLAGFFSSLQVSIILYPLI
jgi:hypothetical protein